MNTPQSEVTSADIASPGNVRTVRAAAIGAAAVGALLIWVIAHPVAGIDLVEGSGGNAQTIGPAAVLLVSVIVGLAAIGLAALLTRVLDRSRRTWLMIAVLVLVVSLTGPLGAATLGAGLALAAMHLVVGATLIVGIGRTL
jgi:hypothetical protein